MAYFGTVTFDATEYLIGSTLYGVSNSPASNPDKIVSGGILGRSFDELVPGISVNILFTYGSTIDTCTLKIGSTTALPVYGKMKCGANALLQFTYSTINGTPYWVLSAGEKISTTVMDTYDSNSSEPISGKGVANAIAPLLPNGVIYTNKYHTTGSWSGLTYTATAVNNAEELKFTIPNKIQSDWELNAASEDSPALIFTRDDSLTDWRILVQSGKLSFQSGTDASTWTERAYFKDNSGNFVANSFEGSTLILTQESTADSFNIDKAHIEFNNSGDQPIYISYTPNDSYHTSAGLKILGNGTATSDSSSPAWLEVEGSIFADGGYRVPTAGNTTGTVGSNNTPVYINAGVITVINKKDTANELINALDTDSSDLTSDDYVITQYIGGGTTTKTYHRRSASKVINSTLVKTALGTDASTTNKWLNKKGEWSTPTATQIGAATSDHTHDTIKGVKYYAYDTKAGKTYIGWIKIASFNLNDSNQYGRQIYDIFIDRDYNSPQPEVYSLRICAGWMHTSIVQLNGQFESNSQIIDKFRIVRDHTNHKGYLEYHVKTSYTTYENNVQLKIIGYYAPTLATLNEVQTEEESAFAEKEEINLTRGITGYGSGLTNLNGSNISSGIIGFSYLPTGTGAEEVAIGNHTHSYAGSDSVGGAANSLKNFTTTTSTNTGLEITTAVIGYVNDLTRADWNYQQNDGALYGQYYNASQKAEIFQDYRTGQLSVRGKNNGTWQNWRRILDETNGATILGLGTMAGETAAEYAKLASPTLTGTPTAPTASDDTNSTQIATTAFVWNMLKYADAMIFKGVLNGAATTTYTPAAERGHTYKVGTAGLINGIQVEVGDVLICLDDNTPDGAAVSLDQVTPHWVIVQNNVDGAVFKGTTDFDNGCLIVADGTSGKVKTAASVAGAFSINTGASAFTAFSIQNTSASEKASHWVDSTVYHIDYTNNDAASEVQLKLTNTGTNGANYTYKFNSAGQITGATFTGKAATAGSADQLINTHTIWGQSFDGTDNIIGNMITVGPVFQLPPDTDVNNPNIFTFQDGSERPARGWFGYLHIGSDDEITTLDTYKLNVSGKVRINVPTADTVTNENDNTITYDVDPLDFIVTHTNGNVESYLSIYSRGIQAYNDANDANNPPTLSLQEFGGNLNVGSSAASGTNEFYGTFNFNSQNGFNYQGIQSNTNNAACPIWFSINTGNLNHGIPTYNGNFTYNPSSSLLTVGDGQFNGRTLLLDGGNNNNPTIQFNRGSSTVYLQQTVVTDQDTNEITTGINITSADWLSISTGKVIASSFKGDVVGNASSATSLATARELYVTLSNVKEQNHTTLFDGTTNADITVTGTLGIGNGGTGENTLTGARTAFNSPEYIRGTWSSTNSTWTGETVDTALYEGKQIVLYMPYNGTTTAATLTLFLGSPNSNTGALPVYLENTTRLTNQKKQNQHIHLIYHQNLLLSDGNQYTGWWYVDGKTDISDSITGILNIANGGTGHSSWIANQLIKANSTGTALEQIAFTDAATASTIVSRDSSGSFSGVDITATRFLVSNQVSLQWNTTDESLDFVFA